MAATVSGDPWVAFCDTRGFRTLVLRHGLSACHDGRGEARPHRRHRRCPSIAGFVDFGEIKDETVADVVAGKTVERG